MKITIISAYTWYNKGDSAILLGTIEEISNYLPENVEFNILTFTPEIDGIKYQEAIPNMNMVLSNIFNPYPLKKNKVEKLKAITKMGIQFCYLKLNKKKLEKLESYRLCESSDIVIVCGGGFLGGNKYNSLIHLAQIDLLRKASKKMILWGTSIEPPTKKILKYLTQKQLAKLDAILPRERITESYLKTFYDNKKIFPTPDMAFSLKKITSNKNIDLTWCGIKEHADKKSIIGITMRDWKFPRSKNPLQAKIKYENALIEFINNSKDAIFLFIPQVIMFGDDDRIFARGIKSKLKNKDKFIILEDDYSPMELKWFIKNCDQFVGTRMHSNIFSSLVGNPPVAIAYENKTNGIMQMLGLSDYVVDIEDVNSQTLNELLLKNKYNKHELVKKLDENINDFEKKTRNTTISIFEEII